MTLEIKKLDEKRFELVETLTAVKDKEQLKLFKKNILEGIAQTNAQRLQAELGTKDLLKKLQIVNTVLGLKGSDGLTMKEEKK